MKKNLSYLLMLLCFSLTMQAGTERKVNDFTGYSFPCDIFSLGKCLCDEKLVNCSANPNYSEVAIDFLEMHLESLEGRQFKEGFI